MYMLVVENTHTHTHTHTIFHLKLFACTMCNDDEM